VKQVQWSRALTIVALTLIIVAASIAWLAALGKGDDAEKPTYAVVNEPLTRCGKLVNSGDALAIQTSNSTVVIPSGAQVTIVDSCPK
jgi:hypothetical protein